MYNLYISSPVVYPIVENVSSLEFLFRIIVGNYFENYPSTMYLSRLYVSRTWCIVEGLYKFPLLSGKYRAQ